MSEEGLRSFIEKVGGDPDFAKQLSENGEEAVAGFDLTVTEKVALSEGDEDALRRLAGSEVEAFRMYSRSDRSAAQMRFNPYRTVPRKTGGNHYRSDPYDPNCGTDSKYSDCVS